MTAPNTLFLRLSGPMQAWGTGSRLQIRRSDPYPSKSGVLGILLCALGVRRSAAQGRLKEFARLLCGVRIDRPGTLDWDYHTVGAKIGIRQAEGGIKRTASTKEFETLLSRRQYILDSSFLVALHGDTDLIDQATDAIKEPVWPFFLGRKCCIPSEPVYSGTGSFVDLHTALGSVPFSTGTHASIEERVALRAILEHPPGAPPPPNAFVVYDVPRTFSNPSHGPRWVYEASVSAEALPREQASTTRGRQRVNYRSEQWRTIRKQRLQHDSGLCVFCKAPAEEVHHINYERAGDEEIADLRSLCRLCHDACTQLEYGGAMSATRIDPSDQNQRDAILAQVKQILTDRRVSRRRSVRETAASKDDFFNTTATS